MAGRVQVQDLQQPEPMQPTPIQSDTFTGAPSLGGENGYLQLADALGHFSSALINLNNSNKLKSSKDPTLENNFAKMTEAERAQVARTGVMPDGTNISGNKIHGPGIMKAAGMADAAVFERSLQDTIQNHHDWTQGDIDAYLTKAQNDYMAKNGITDPYAVKGFLERFDRTREWALGEQQKYRMDAADKYKGDVTFQLLNDGINKMIGDGKTPEDIHKGVRGMYSTLGKDGTLGIDYNKLDSYVVQIAGNLASTNPEVAKELLTAERPGAGAAKAPIASKLEYKTQTDAIIKAADKAIVKRDADAQEQDLYKSNLIRVMKDGDFSAFRDFTIPDGTENGRTITKKQQEDQLTKQWVDYTDGLVTDHKVTETAAAEQQVYFLRSMGLDHPYLKNEIDHIEKRVGPDVITNPTSEADIEARIRKYRELNAASKNYTQSQLSQPTKDFLDAIDIAQKYEHYDMPRALLFANRVTNPTEGQVVDLARYRDDITTKVKSTFATGFAGFGNDMNNDGVMLGTYVARTESYATKLVAAGMDPTKAIDVAARRLKDNLPTFNGRAMPGLEQQPLADNWQEGLKDLIEKNIKPNMSNDFKDQEVFPVVIDGGRMIFENADGQIVKNKQGQPMATSVQLMNAQSLRLQRDAAAGPAGAQVGKLVGDQQAITNAANEQQRRERIRKKQEPGFLDREGIFIPPLNQH